MEISNDVIAEIAQHSNELAEILGKGLSFILPGFIKENMGQILSGIAPIWNPVWISFNELLEMLFGF